MNPYDLIAKKQSGKALTRDELAWLIGSYTNGELPDYQMSAFLMAVYFQGLSEAETVGLVDIMLHSGQTIDLSSLPGSPIDKHSTGGVGDKVSLILAPLVAAAGVPVPMISGRGLGHTGGTLDKLESIPGLTTEYTIDGFVSQVRDIGVCIMGSNRQIAPADRKLYALRDVTATIKSIPLICGSILSKKLAEGVEGLVLDVKTGSGAFLPEYEDSRELAARLVAISKEFGLKCQAVITDMNQPLGYRIGNWNEVVESLACLRGEGPEDLMEVTLELGTRMLMLAGEYDDPGAARTALETRITSGAALEKFRELVQAQDGDVHVLDHPGNYPRSKYSREVRAKASGNVTALASYEIGMGSVSLGAGRRQKGDAVDPRAGITLTKKLGDTVEIGETLATLYTDRETVLETVTAQIRNAFTISDNPPQKPTLIHEIID